VRVNSGDDVATSYKNLANFCLLTLEIMEFICVLGRHVFGENRPTHLLVMLTFRNVMEHSNADGRINSGSDQATHDINLVGF